MPDLTTVFDAAGLGYVTTRIPALVVTPGDTLLAFCEARHDRSDWAPIDILLRRSTDGGRTWTEPRILVAGEGKVAGNPTPIVDRDGRVHLLFQRGYARVFVISSGDDGSTWNEPLEITPTFETFRPEYDWEVVAPGPGHAIQLRSGRLLVPVWLCDPDPSIPGGDHRPSCVATVYSDDGGATWQRGEIVAATTPEYRHPSESVAVELGDGRVMLNIRSESPQHRRLVSCGPDGIGGWSKPVFDEALFEPICMASMIQFTLPDDRRCLLFCNPDSSDRLAEPPSEVWFSPRENLTVRLSWDEGRSWPISRVLEPGIGGYSDLAVGRDGMIYCLYEAGLPNGAVGRTTHLALARFDLDWVTEG
jgi:sialidase-1